MKKYTKYKPKNLIDDQLFKFVFSHETLAKQLIDALSKYINIDWDFSKVELKIQQIIPGKHHDSKDYYSDLMVVMKNSDVLLFEAYNKFRKKEFVKSKAYQDRVFSEQFDKGEEYENPKRVIIVNFIRGNFDTNKVLDKYSIVNLETLNEPIKDFNNCKLFIVIKVDKCPEAPYNEDDEFLQIGNFLKCKDVAEMEEKVREGGNKFMEESLAFVKAYMADKSNDNYGSHYRLELDYAYEDGQKKGSRDTQIATAQKMISLGSNDEFISKTTGLSINKINALRKKMQL